MKYGLLTAAGLAVSASSVMAQSPVLDGRLAGDEARYGAPKWLQTVPTSLTDNHPDNQAPCATTGNGVTIAIDNSNTAGVTGADATGAPLVTSGIEIRIPFAQLGNPTGPIKIAGFINGGGHDFLSNQVIGGLPPGTGNLAEPRNVNFSDSLGGQAGNQFITVLNPAIPPAVAVTMDGQLGADPYGSLLFTQMNPTGFGDSNLGVIDYANGSEIDGVYAFVGSEDPDGAGPEPVQSFLYVLVTGNLESNFNKLDLFVDCVDGGQNRLRGDNAPIDFNGLNRMGDDGSGNGLRFDDGFEADRWLGFTCGGATFATFGNFAEVPTGGGGTGNFIGSGGAGMDALIGQAVCPPTIPDQAYAIGSELDAVYSYLDEANNRLYVLITGNLASTTEDKLNLFIDANGNPAGDEGQNTLRDNNVVISIADGGGGSLRRMGFNGIDPGLTFDTGFAADYYMNFHYEATPIRHAMDAALLRTGGPNRNFLGNPLDYGSFAGVNVPGVIPWDGTNFTDFTTPVGIQFQDGFAANVYAAYPPREAARVLAAAQAAGIIDIPTWEAFVPTEAVGGLLLVASDNSNIAGVTDVDASGAASAVTGLEFSIDLTELGWDGVSDIRLAGFISSPNFATVSNQVLGDATGQTDLGDPRQVNFNQFPGDQYVRLTGGDGPTDCNGNGINDADEIAGGAADCFDPTVVASPNTMGGSDGALDACQCAANFNRDGAVNSNDISAFLTSWLNAVGGGPASADLSCDGVTNSNDISAFLTLWLSAVQNTVPFDGCP